MVIYGSFAVALVYGAWRVAAGDYTGGTVMNVLIAVLLGGFAIMQGAPNIQYVIRGRIAGARVFRLVERKPEIHIDRDPSSQDSNKEASEKDPEAPDRSRTAPVVIQDKDVKGEIKLNSIVFSYPARPDVKVFDGFSIVIPAGKTMALVGESGSGKSTVVGLIERFYDPQGGSVMLDGVDIRSLRLSWLRDQVGLVSQEPVLFATTVKDNIAMGRPNATDEEILVRKMIDLCSPLSPSSPHLHPIPFSFSHCHSSLIGRLQQRLLMLTCLSRGSLRVITPRWV